MPVERKENVIYPRESNTTQITTHSTTSTINRMFARSNSRPKGLSLRTRAKREVNIRGKARQDSTQSAIQRATTSNLIHSRLKSDIAISKTKESPKRLKVSSSFHKSDSADRLKLKEICFVKQNMSKKVIAKFMNKEPMPKEHDDNDDLVVAWDSDCSPRVLSLEKAESSKFKPENKFKVEPSTSSKTATRGTLKNSFNKVKRPKNSLRRLATANNDNAGKVDKLKKRKKLKSKII